MKQKSNYASSNYGEGVVPNVLATCYVVDSVGSLKGLHYCSTWDNGMLISREIDPLLYAWKNCLLTHYNRGRVVFLRFLFQDSHPPLQAPPSSP